ncbi:MAG: sigma-70 family RNA polymerase sigma factor [Phycisphaerales bacterium]|nr:sigma-70 family RNA polymerase sigma factor [Phycisphaerales bacterium]
MNRSAHENEPSDAELVRRAQRGLSAAFGTLVERYQERIYNTCYRMCHNHADAQDLTQSAFVRALEALDQFAGRSNFYTWLFRIAMNLTLSHRRQTLRRTATLLGAGGAARADEEQTAVSRGLEQAETEARVAGALALLDAEFRAAVILKDLEDMDYATIAEVLEVPVGTVKSRIHRGRLQLRELLSPERDTVDRARA